MNKRPHSEAICKNCGHMAEFHRFGVGRQRRLSTFYRLPVCSGCKRQKMPICPRYVPVAAKAVRG